MYTITSLKLSMLSNLRLIWDKHRFFLSSAIEMCKYRVLAECEQNSHQRTVRGWWSVYTQWAVREKGSEAIIPRLMYWEVQQCWQGDKKKAEKHVLSWKPRLRLLTSDPSICALLLQETPGNTRKDANDCKKAAGAEHTTSCTRAHNISRNVTAQNP